MEIVPASRSDVFLSEEDLCDDSSSMNHEWIADVK